MTDFCAAGNSARGERPTSGATSDRQNPSDRPASARRVPAAGYEPYETGPPTPRASAAGERGGNNLNRFKDFHTENGSSHCQNLAVAVLCVLYTSHPTPYTLHPTPYTLHPTPSALRPTPQTLTPQQRSSQQRPLREPCCSAPSPPPPSTPHSSPYTLHPTPYTLHPTTHFPHQAQRTLMHKTPPRCLGLVTRTPKPDGRC